MKHRTRARRPATVVVGLLLAVTGCTPGDDPTDAPTAGSSTSPTTSPTTATTSSSTPSPPTKTPVDSTGQMEVVGTRAGLTFLVPADWWVLDRTVMPDDAADLPTEADSVLRQWGYDPDEFVRELPETFDALAGGVTVDGIGSRVTVFPYSHVISDEQLTGTITTDQPTVRDLTRSTSDTPLGRATSVTYTISPQGTRMYMQELALPRGTGTTIISVGATHPNIADDVMDGILDTMEEYETLSAPARG